MDKHREAIEIIHRSSEQLLTLLNGLSDLFGFEAKEIKEQNLELKVFAEALSPEIDRKKSSRSSGAHPGRSITGFSSPLTDSTQKILVVDDNDQNRTFIKDILSPLGFEIMEAVNGHEALNTIRDFQPDVILMDLVMPGMDGFEAIRQIRQIPEFKEAIVIGISASAYDTTKEESFAAGCNDFLSKPFQIEEILECLHVHLGVEWIYESIPEANSENLPVSETLSLVTPPQEILEELLEFAEGGCITDIRKSIANMKEFDHNLIPFANRIEQLTENFQFEQVIESIKSYLEATY
jgi:CheY-like chemotaxis protein